MGFFEDVKKEWTWEGFKKQLKEDWTVLLSVAIAGLVTHPVLKLTPWQDSFLFFFAVNTAVFLLSWAITNFFIAIKNKHRQ